MKEDQSQKRAPELENIVGDLLITKYQVKGLRDRIVDKIGGRYTCSADNIMSTYIF